MSKLFSELALVFSLLCIVLGRAINAADHWILETEEYTMARINISYFDSRLQNVFSESAEMAKFGTGQLGSASGLLVHIRTGNGSSHHGCDPHYDNPIPRVPWIALVRRGKCNFDDKLENAYLNNASALIVYNNKDDGLQKMTLRNKYRDRIVAVFMSRAKGEELSFLVDNGTTVDVNMEVGTHYSLRLTNLNKTSVLFVSISFIVLMLISLAWLAFYYVQRFRHLHEKDERSKQLTNAARKALAKIPTRTVRSSDKIVADSETCSICIEPYKSGDILRDLPCKHEFHKSCVDPWLLEHRTCPLCKMDILRHYGLPQTEGPENSISIDMASPIISSSRNAQ